MSYGAQGAGPKMMLEHDIQVIYIDYIGLIDAEASRIPRHEQIPSSAFAQATRP
jgi:hypothetical protein